MNKNSAKNNVQNVNNGVFEQNPKKIYFFSRQIEAVVL